MCGFFSTHWLPDITRIITMLVAWEIIDSLLTGAKRREWMGLGVAGMIITSAYGSFPKIPC